jgi:hypothetical protein
MGEDELGTFEDWLRNTQGIDPASVVPEQLTEWRDAYDEIRKNPTPKVGLMKFKPLGAGENRYAVAIRDGSDRWLTLWVRRAPKGDVFIVVPRADRDWDPHASYHRDGTFHHKSFGRKFESPQKRQPLTESFRGTEHLGGYGGHGKTIGAICDPEAFSDVLEVPPGILESRAGVVVVDLVEPGVEPLAWPFTAGKTVSQKVFKDAVPWLVIRAGSTS